MADARRARAWGLVVEAARRRGGPVSVADVCESAVAAVGAAGAAVSLMAGRDVREMAYATDGVATRLEELQFTLAEGPCVDAFASGVPVTTVDMSGRAVGARWPGFASAAVAAGAVALFVFPLSFGTACAGVLSLYRSRSEPLSSDALADALVFTDLALMLVLDTWAETAGEPESWPLGGPADGRVEVYQASGMVSVQLGMGVGEAFARLRGYAFAHDRLLHEVAADVVARRLRLEADGPERSG